MRRLPPLPSLRAFEAAARHLSFKKAAEELGVTPTAVSHQIRQLEASLGQQLFRRLTRRVELTDAGRDLFPALRDGFDLFSKAVERVRAEPEHPCVVVTTTTAFAAHWLVPRLSAFRTQHPRITLSVLASDDVVSLESGQADLAVRLSGDTRPSLGATRLFRDGFSPVASPSMAPARLQDLQQMPLIDFQWRHPAPERPDWSKWLEAAGLAHVSVEPRLRFNQELHALQAAIAGQGIALFSLTIADDVLRQGLLVRPFGTVIPGQTYFLLRSQERVARPEVDAVAGWLLEQAAAGGSTC